MHRGAGNLACSRLQATLPHLWLSTGAEVAQPPKRARYHRQSRRIHISTNLVHNGAMRMATKTIRQSISLPAGVASKVRSLAKTRRLSANRMLVELIEDGIEAHTRKQQQFFELAERFRGATDPDEAKRLGDELGRMVFGG
jgi:hypothetical protein